MIEKINFQKMSKIEVSDGKQLLVHSIFFTIQGEGPHVGKPSVFVRLGGCNLQCPGCDTEYTAGAAHEDIDSILTRVRMAFSDYSGERLVVITGGEPFRQNIIPFANALVKSGHRVQVESNGTVGFRRHQGSKDPWFQHPYPAPHFEIVVSPKAGKVDSELFDYISAYKYVLDANNLDPKDGLPTSVLGLPGRPARPHASFSGKIYVQPADEQCEEGNEFNMEACINSAKRFGYQVSLQTHKLMGVD